MNQWGFFEIAGLETWAKLAQYQHKNYGTKLDKPVFMFDGKPKKPISYPTLEECDRDMKRVVGEISPGKTRGIR